MRRVPFVPVRRLRVLRCALLAVAAIALPSRPALSVECGEFPAPTGLTVQMESTFQGKPQVVLRWSPVAGQDANPEFQFRYWRIERRDDTAGGAFQSLWDNGAQPSSTVIPPLDDYSTSSFFSRVEDPAAFPPCVGVACPKPGRTYTYRVMPRYSHAFGCDQYANNAVKSGPATAEVQIVVPGPAPANTAPKDVVAVADTKKPRVDVTWQSGGGEPTAFVIRRREIADPAAKGPRAEAAFAEVGRVPAKARKFSDRTVEGDKVYEYVVDAVAAALTQTSAADRAYPAEKRCPPSQFDLWDGLSFQGSPADGDPSLDLYFNTDEGRAALAAQFEDTDTKGGRISIVAETARPIGDAAGWKADARVLLQHEDGPPWARDLVAGHTGTLKAAYLAANSPLDSSSFRRIYVNLDIRPGAFPKVALRFPATKVRQPGDLLGIAKLCATVAAGNLKPVAIGDEVVILFQCVNLGPAPLYSRRAVVDVTVEKGEIVEAVTGDWFEQEGALEDAPVRFRIGAIGPAKNGNSERATLGLRVKVTGPLDGDRQMRCTFDLGGDANSPFVDEQRPEWTRPDRIVEVPIAAPAKR